MNQHVHQHAFITPIMHQSSPIQPAPMFNMHLPRAAARPSFAPVTAFHRATQKPFRSTKRGRWGAMHVCIAWKIHYHKQLKKMQQKPNSLHQEVTPEFVSTCQPDREQHKGSDQPSCININSPCGHSAYGNTGDRSETGETLSHFNRSYLSDLPTSSPASCFTTKREKLEHPPNLQRREKLDEKEKQAETTQDLPLRDKTRDRTTTPEPDGRLDRKRHLECDASIGVKRVKLDVVDDSLHSDPSLFTTTHPSSHSMPLQHISDLSVMYPNSSNVTRTHGTLTEMHPYQSASWEPMWDLHSRQNLLQDYSLNTCKAIRIPPAAHRQKETFHGFFTPPLYFPLSLRQQETVYLRGREFLHSRHENCHLQHPGYLATSYMGL